MKTNPKSYHYAGPLVLLVSLLAAMLTGCGRQKETETEAAAYQSRATVMSVSVAPVEKRAISVDQEFTGDLLPWRRTRIVAEVEGVVQTIPQTGVTFDVTLDGQRYQEQLGLNYGQPVKAGELLTQLDPRDFEIAVRMAQAKLAKAQADLAELKSSERPEELRRLEAMRDEVIARHEQAKRELGRMESLAPSGVVTASEYEQSKMEVSTAAAIVSAAEASLASAQAGPTAEEVAIQQALVDQAQAEIDQKKHNLEKTTIRAPYDGVVTAINLEVGERVSPSGEPLLEIMDLRYLVAEISVPESFVGVVRVNDRAAISASGSSEKITGLVVAINEMVDPETRTFRVRVAIDNQRTRLKAGQFVAVRLLLGGDQSASLVAPSRAIILLEGQPHVYVLAGDRVEQRRVSIGLSTEKDTELLNGVMEGERVVVDDPSRVGDGMMVKVQSGESRVAKKPSATSF